MPVLVLPYFILKRNDVLELEIVVIVVAQFQLILFFKGCWQIPLFSPVVIIYVCCCLAALVSCLARSRAASCIRRICSSMDGAEGTAALCIPCAPNPPINVASICLRDGIHSANCLRYSNSDAMGLYSKYTVSKFCCPQDSFNGTTASKEAIWLLDNQSSSNPCKWVKGAVVVNRFLLRSSTFNFGKDAVENQDNPSSSIPLWAKYNSSKISCCVWRFSIRVNRFDWTSSRRSLVNCHPAIKEERVSMTRFPLKQILL